MKASWYERAGDPHDVLELGVLPAPSPGPGDVRIRVRASGVNPGDVKKRRDEFALGLAFPRIVPHSDGAGVVDAVGEDVPADWIGARVWCFGAQSYRPFGTAAELCTVPAANVVRLPASVGFDQGALLGIPGLTAHAAVHAGGEVAGRTVLVQGGAGAVGSVAVRLAQRAGARVLATARNPADLEVARAAGAEHVLQAGDGLAAAVQGLAPEGVAHIVEVALGANAAVDAEVLQQGGSIAVYASDTPLPTIPVWPLVFKNARLSFLGSDDFSPGPKRAAAEELTRAAAEGWVGLPVAARFGLERIADAHALVEAGTRGRVLLELGSRSGRHSAIR